MSERNSDSFENGIFWELYQDLERQFQNFLEYVPYLEENKQVISPKLLNLILGISGYIDSAFKEMARYPKFSNNDDCRKILEKLRESEESIKKGEPPITIPIKLCLKAFEKEYKLSERKIIFKRSPEREDITPFKPYNLKTNAPKWWEIYNGLKHDVGVNIREANLHNTRDALAGAFLLNVIHIPSALRLFDRGILKVEYLTTTRVRQIMEPIKTNRDIVQGWLEQKQGYPGLVETPIFIYGLWLNKKE